MIALRKAKDRAVMDIEGLIKNLQALEDILKSKTLRESESLNDLSSSLERFEALSDLKSCDKEIFHRNPKKTQAYPGKPATVNQPASRIVRRSNRLTRVCFR